MKTYLWEKECTAVLVLYKYCSYFCDFVGICLGLVLTLKRLSFI